MARLSAVIPTRDRGELLSGCVEALLRQESFAGELEIVVIDDGSEEDIRQRVARPRSRAAAVRCVRQPPAGLNAARNRGVEEAAGEIIAFLDDDALPGPAWARSLAEAFEREHCDGMGGRVTLQLGKPPPRWLSPARRRYLAEFDLGGEPRWLDEVQPPVGANCAVTRGAFEKLGGFREDLDRVGSSLVSSGETEFFRRLLRAGGRVLYVPGAHVVHRIEPARLEPAYFRRRAYAQGVSDVRSAWGLRPWPLELIRPARAVPIVAKNLLQGRGAFGARLWLDYCRGRRAAMRRGGTSIGTGRGGEERDRHREEQTVPREVEEVVE